MSRLWREQTEASSLQGKLFRWRSWLRGGGATSAASVFWVALVVVPVIIPMKALASSTWPSCTNHHSRTGRCFGGKGENCCLEENTPG